MTRGRQPVMAINEAKEIAANYGIQTFGRPPDETGCDFVVIRETAITLVWVMRVEKKFLSPYELEIAKAERIAQIRKYPKSSGVFHEIWLRSPRGVWRFFRVYENALVEMRGDREIPAIQPVPTLPAPTV